MTATNGSTRIEGTRPFDVVALGIVTASILLFIATGSAIGPDIVASWMGHGPGPDRFIVNAFVLNIAIIIFGWSRYRQLSQELVERMKAEADARHLAETDPLTGFLNRRSFHARAEELVAEAHKADRAVAFVMIDLDNFKLVNDYNGHSAGDELLRECAERIARIVPVGSAMSRIGGDEFALAVPFEPGNREQVDRLAETLLTQIGRTARAGTVTVEVTASIGLSRSDKPGIAGRPVSAHAMLEEADVAMYHAKHRGRNSFDWFDPQMGEEMRFRTQFENQIREGMRKREFVPFYERQIDLQTGKLTGFEMLARWKSPTLGLVSPEIFIPIAEDIGAIAELSELVIRQALEDAREWDPSLSLAVNISPMQLRDPWFAQKLLKLLVEANFPPERLEIEITESCLHQNLTQVRSLLTSLKNQGIRVTLDDFGTGYNSLAQLRSLPFDRIKIDRSYVTSVGSDADNAAIVHSLALLGKGLNLPITAEGIETADVLEHLMQYGDLKGQGYLYGQPRPAGQLGEWLSDAALARQGSGESPIALSATSLPVTGEAICAEQAKLEARRA
ncbi:EAL domain-containing protein [Novosphingobium sp. YJ-S2-02]|uniref:EAL domain-containing protein n=1 Tax=Novosphingobium aureum TaxID=2792964 RepID=A0A931MKZ1_9SPHN|nr:EAL domain-containing protein [Novosphingobium aureum]MBH0112959.1 EAL domain-containing protein [Novosphingobium aureum]